MISFQGTKVAFGNLIRETQICGDCLDLSKDIISHIHRAFLPNPISANGIKIYWFRKTYVYPLAFSTNKYEPHTFKLLSTLITPDMTVLDIGSNIGLYTLFFAKSVGHVYAFDPQPENCAVLKKSLKVNGLTNTTVIQKAVSNKEGKTTLYTKEKGDGGASIHLKSNHNRLAQGTAAFRRQRNAPPSFRIDIY
jgi:FkbM family methyltransferase